MIESIAVSMRRLVWMLSIPSFVLSTLGCIFGYIIYVETADVKAINNKIEVVVAKTNMVSGAIMSRSNLGLCTYSRFKLKDMNYISRDEYRVLLGHRVLNSVGYGDPIEWQNTSIIITNDVSLQGDVSVAN